MSLNCCRLCLCYENLGPLFVDPQEHTKYISVLALTTGLEIEPNDGLPQHICIDCRDLVNSAINLRNKSQQSELKLIQDGCNKLTRAINADNQLFTEDNDIGACTISVEVQMDRLTDMDDVETSISKKSLSRKEKKEILLNLVDGPLDPKGPVKCKECKKTLSNWACFISHSKLHLGFKYVCEFCGKSFISSTQLKRHCRSHHGMKRELRCKHCSYLALDNAQLVLHERRTHTGERPFICDVCAATYHSRRCLVQHIENHREVATVQCPACPRMFKSQRHLSRHRYTAHAGSARVRCDVCSRMCSRGYLSAHMAKHHPEDRI